ncbi:14906_t:CDS:1, partial [Dentiscutata erythropus]
LLELAKAYKASIQEEVKKAKYAYLKNINFISIVCYYIIANTIF